ncbi:hypothetical protein CBF35_02680 [Vagococcus salmoninarum]|uniref:Uncharacterized protein n=1 Tax=Vagococcus salmoninarum TaxID=2739 RepID=A0A429ZU74_9ENTE|nr:hypothetical protein CBF35_02680 [Vagococcus salmoninarum]
MLKLRHVRPVYVGLMAKLSWLIFSRSYVITSRKNCPPSPLKRPMTILHIEQGDGGSSGVWGRGGKGDNRAGSLANQLLSVCFLAAAFGDKSLGIYKDRPLGKRLKVIGVQPSALKLLPFMIKSPKRQLTVGAFNYLIFYIPFF